MPRIAKAAIALDSAKTAIKEEIYRLGCFMTEISDLFMQLRLGQILWHVGIVTNLSLSVLNVIQRADMIGRLALIILFVVLLPVGLFSQEEEEEENPHKEMMGDQAVCLDCHTKLPKGGETSPDYFLVDLPSENCLGCHSEMEHAGVKEHEGKVAKPLPGDENGKIACFTCHDPHPQGAIKGRVVYDADINERSRKFIQFVVIPYIEKKVEMEIKSKTEKEVYLRLPVGNNELCAKCHETLNETNWRRNILWDKFSGPFSTYPFSY